MSKHLFWGSLLIVLSFILFVAPFGVLFLYNYNEWVDTDNAIDIFAGALIGMAYGVLVLRGALKSISPKISALVGMGVVLTVIWFLDPILEDLFWIVLSIMGGYILWLIVFAIGTRQLEIYRVYRNEKVRSYARAEYSNETDEFIGSV